MKIFALKKMNLFYIILIMKANILNLALRLVRPARDLGLNKITNV
jgi:hypothetical protein